MSNLIGSLLNETKALSAHQRGLETAGRNIANVNNPAYARQRVVLGDRAVVQTPQGPQGTGVEALAVQQIRDRFLDIQVSREMSQTASLETQQSNLLKAQADLGEEIDRSADSASINVAGGATNGISSALNDFFNAFDELSASPTDTGAKQVLLQKAAVLAEKFNVTDSRLASLQSDIDQQIGSDVTNANGLLGEIGRLNGEIMRAEVTAPGSAVDLRDQRQARIEGLSKIMNFTAQEVPGGAGQIQISSTNGVTLLDKTTALTLAFNGTQLTAGTPPIPLTLAGGSIHGALAVRDGAIADLRANVKTTADQLTAAVNVAYNGNFFQTIPATGLIQLDPTLTVSTLKTTDSGNAGANELALAVAALGDRKFATGSGDLINGSLGGFFSQTVSGFGQSISGVESRLNDQNAVEGMLRAQRDSVSGVSMDEEMADLMKFQRAYQASARVISIIDSMLDTVVNGLGR